MTFTYDPERFDDGSGSDRWFSGIYKIVRYDGYSDGILRISERYAAYFKPTGWLNWGNHVKKSTPFYTTLEEAKKACAQHQRTFNRPHEFNSL